MFDFDQKNFFLNFARGRMTYRIAADDPADELPTYLDEGRWIVEQELNLTPAQRAKLAEFLDWNARPENAQYRYDYFTANCSTRVRDALDTALGGAITAANDRAVARLHLPHGRVAPDAPETRADVLAWMPASVRSPTRALSYWDESFVPMEFMRHLREIKVTRCARQSRAAGRERNRDLADARLPDPPEFAAGLVLARAGRRHRRRARRCSGSRASAHARGRARPSRRSRAVIAFALGIGGLVLLATVDR